MLGITSKLTVYGNFSTLNNFGYENLIWSREPNTTQLQLQASSFPPTNHYMLPGPILRQLQHSLKPPTIPQSAEN